MIIRLGLIQTGFPNISINMAPSIRSGRPGLSIDPILQLSKLPKMKKLLLLLVCTSAGWVARSQPADYRVVFDMTSRDSMNQQALVRELTLIRSGNPASKLEVVLYGQGIDLAIRDRCPLQPAVQKLLGDTSISIRICEMAMLRNHIDRSQLLPGVVVVPDGIYEIITRQREGWGYIKVGR